MPMYSQNDGGQQSLGPKDAATVILVRERNQGGFEVFLMRRHKKQSFMGGAYVFPGGRLDPEDMDPALSDFAKGLDAEKAKQSLQEPKLSGEQALGLFFCALRETFEEAGVLLANCDDNPFVCNDPETEARFLEYRALVHEQKLSIKELAEKENLTFSLDLMTPYSHWITPEIERKRFDTRFFIAIKPAGQKAAHDEVELVNSLWASPAQALEKHDAGEIMLMPPTLVTLEELSEFSSIQELLKETRAREIYPILPQGFKTDDGFGVMLPNDPDYRIPGYQRPPRPGETCRLVMKDKKWRTVKA